MSRWSQLIIRSVGQRAMSKVKHTLHMLGKGGISILQTSVFFTGSFGWQPWDVFTSASPPWFVSDHLSSAGRLTCGITDDTLTSWARPLRWPFSSSSYIKLWVRYSSCVVIRNVDTVLLCCFAFAVPTRDRLLRRATSSIMLRLSYHSIIKLRRVECNFSCGTFCATVALDWS